MDQFFQTIADKLHFYDSEVAKYIDSFLKPYQIPLEGLSVASHIPLFIRIIIYLTLLLIPLSLIKLFFVDSGKLTLILALLFITICLLTLGVMLGFFQLLYTFNV